jgi:integrase
LTAVLLAKPVSLLTSDELEKWRNGLLGKIQPATINRMCSSLCAALNFVARHDRRITSHAWDIGLAGLPNAQAARNVVLPDATVRAFVSAAYDRDAKLGLLVDVLATTGTRPSQAVRLRIEDLHDHPTRPKLSMPRSGKGGGRNRSAKKSVRFSVPISPALSAKLREAAAGRAHDEPLLTRADGGLWRADPSADYRAIVREIVASLGEDADRVTMYCLRHSSVVRMLLKNVPIRLVASLHDTSVAQIERNYSRFITEHSDEHARAALLEDPAPTSPPAGKVVPISGR